MPFLIFPIKFLKWHKDKKQSYIYFLCFILIILFILFNVIIYIVYLFISYDTDYDEGKEPEYLNKTLQNSFVAIWHDCFEIEPKARTIIYAPFLTFSPPIYKDFESSMFVIIYNFGLEKA